MFLNLNGMTMLAKVGLCFLSMISCCYLDPCIFHQVEHFYQIFRTHAAHQNVAVRMGAIAEASSPPSELRLGSDREQGREQGKIWFVRPLGGDYSSEDGRSLVSAFDGFSNIKWGVDGVKDGDIIYVLGKHRETFNVRASNITIRLDHESDPGVIYGSSNLDGGSAAWKGPNTSGLYCIALPVECKVVARDEEILLRGKISSLAADEWAWENGLLCLGSKPVGHVFEVGQRNHAVTWDENLPIRNTTVIGDGKGGSRMLYTNQYAIGPNDHYPDQFADGTETYPHKINFGSLTVRGVTFIGVLAVQTYHWYKMDANVIDDCEIYDSPAEGLYLGAGEASVVVRNCRIGSSLRNKFGWGSSGTAHAGDGIDIKGGMPYNVRHAVVAGNIIQNVRGCGIVSGCNDILVENNVIRDCGWSDMQFGIVPSVDYAGIAVGGGAYGLGANEKVIVRNNKIFQTNYFASGIMVGGYKESVIPAEIYNNEVAINTTDNFACYTQPFVNQRYRHIYNNIFNGGKYGIFTVEFGFPVAIVIENNLIKNSIYPLHISDTKNGGIILRNNTFSSANRNSGHFPYRVGSRSYPTVSAMNESEKDSLMNREE
jgi:hypothetical protein